MSQARYSFSALQRAEIAEMPVPTPGASVCTCFSALQRAEIAEIVDERDGFCVIGHRFSALQRAEIAEIR